MQFHNAIISLMNKKYTLIKLKIAFIFMFCMVKAMHSFGHFGDRTCDNSNQIIFWFKLL